MDPASHSADKKDDSRSCVNLELTVDREEAIKNDYYYRYAHRQLLDHSVEAGCNCDQSIRKVTDEVDSDPRCDDSRPAGE